MDAAIIDWKGIKSRFEEDEAYEQIDAPQWVDLTAADDSDNGGDAAWFCRAGCGHPRTLEDWLKLKGNETRTKPPFLGLSPDQYYNVEIQDSDVQNIAKVGEEGSKKTEETSGSDGETPELMRGCLCAGILMTSADYLLFTVAEFCHELRKAMMKHHFSQDLDMPRR